MALETSVIQTKLVDQFDTIVTDFVQLHDILTFEVDSNSITKVIQFLRDDATLRFNFMTDLCGVHYPDNTIDQQFCVVYHLHNWVENTRIRIKTYLNGEKVYEAK